MSDSAARPGAVDTSNPIMPSALMSESETTALRRELKRATGHPDEADELGKLLRDTVLRPECF